MCISESDKSESPRLHPTLIYYGRGVMGERDGGMLGCGERGIEVMGCFGGLREGRRRRTVMEG